MNRKYKKYVITLLLFFFTMLGVYHAVISNSKMFYMSIEYPMWSDIREKINQTNHESYELLCIGDSRAKAGFIPKIYDDKHHKSINLSLGGATPIEGYYILKKYLQNNPTPKKILLSFAPFHIQAQDTYWTRTVTFDFLSWYEYATISMDAYKLLDTTLGDESYLEYKIIGFSYLTNTIKYPFDEKYKNNTKTWQTLQESKGHFFFGKSTKTNRPNQEAQAKDKHFVASKLIDYYLDKLLALAKEKHVPVYWFTMPFSQLSYNLIHNNYKKEYKSYLEKKSKEYDMKILNQLMPLANNYFGDSSHLYNGANVVSNEIKKHLE